MKLFFSTANSQSITEEICKRTILFDYIPRWVNIAPGVIISAPFSDFSEELLLKHPDLVRYCFYDSAKASTLPLTHIAKYDQLCSKEAFKHFLSGETGHILPSEEIRLFIAGLKTSEELTDEIIASLNTEGFNPIFYFSPLEGPGLILSEELRNSPAYNLIKNKEYISGFSSQIL